MNKDPVMVEQSKKVNVVELKSFLDELVFLTTNVVPQIMSLQLPKGSLWLLKLNLLISPRCKFRGLRMSAEFYNRRLRQSPRFVQAAAVAAGSVT